MTATNLITCTSYVTTQHTLSGRMSTGPSVGAAGLHKGFTVAAERATAMLSEPASDPLAT